MLRVLAIYPSFDIHLNEMAIVWRDLCNSSRASCLAVAGNRSRLKGHSYEVDTEEHKHLTIARYNCLWHSRKEICKRAYEQGVDAIFCAVIGNFALASELKRRLGVPLILHTEFFFDDLLLLRRRYHFDRPSIGKIVASLFRFWLIRQSEMILCSNPMEFRDGRAGGSGKIRYLPWPHPVNEENRFAVERDRCLSVHIGSFSKAKGADVLLRYYESLLSNWEDFRLILVGPGRDASGRKALARLKEMGQARVEVRNSCSRAEALRLIQRCLFVLSPGKRLGWGLIGDAWNSGTPVVAIEEHYDLQPDYNCLMARNEREFLTLTSELQTNASLWQRISDGGKETVRRLHSTSHVGNVLLECIKSTKESMER